jgi:predicted RNA-binding protein (virulence factor B family)
MLFRNEIFEPLSLGTSLTGYVKHIRPDHKIDVRLNRDGYQAVDDNVKKLLDVLQANGGQLNVNDKSSPGQIAALLGMSKKIFKKAVGSLYKQKRLQITETSIRLVDGNFDKKGA